LPFLTPFTKMKKVAKDGQNFKYLAFAFLPILANLFY
jgi:hypothetical protein